MSLVLAAGLGTSLGTPVSAVPSAPPEKNAVQEPQLSSGHELPNPLEDKRRELREKALTLLLNGEGQVQQRGSSTVMKVGQSADSNAVNRKGELRTSATESEDQYVELEREATDRIFVVLAEFGDERHPNFPDKDLEPSIPGPATFDGPLHNAIPEPDRNADNSTVWQPDYDQEHYQDIYFGEGTEPGAGKKVESVKTYYERQSSGRYSIDGTVTDWVKVTYNEARYGRSSDNPATNGDDPGVCASHVCTNTWNLVADSVNQWVTDQKADGRTDDQIHEEMAGFDAWDRYDHDADGDFNESDGYIDHFQIVHSGGDEADGDPQQGEDAVWSHRWYVQTRGGPADNPLGGTQVGTTGLWIGDYTIQPENGGMSVFAHEYGHDLGLPDLYDLEGGENGVNFWSMMAQSREAAPKDEGIGTRGADLGAWDKLQLGWLDYETVLPSQKRTLELGPHEYNSENAQAAVVVLPKKEKTRTLVPPHSGTKSWWSGAGDDLNNTMSREVTLGAGAARLTMQANWDIEDCGPDPCDYAFVEVNDGGTWKAIPGSITAPAEGNGVDGASAGWVPATFNLSAYAGKTIGLRFRYQTDGAVGGKGFFADEVAVTSGGTERFRSGAETGAEGWVLNGFNAAGASYTQAYDNYYIASHRDYVSFDKYLESGPYNFGFVNEKPDWVEHFPYQDGLLISYWDTSQSDNSTSAHPGEGLILPIDANPRPVIRLDGAFWRPRIAGYDAAFSMEKSDSFTLHVNSKPNYIRGQKARPTFRDSDKYWYSEQPTAGVKVPKNGVQIKVVRQNETSMQIQVN